MDKRRLLELKDQITDLERGLAQDEGSLRQMLDDLKEQGHVSVEAAEKYLKKLDGEIDRMETELKKGIALIEKTIAEWDGDDA